MERAQIISGAIAGSALVTVAAYTVAEGTTVLVYSGNALLGSIPLAGGLGLVALARQLVAGEVVVAAISEAGNQTGLPVIVADTTIVINGWRTPSELSVTDETGEELLMTAEQFKSVYGYLPASAEDPAGLEPRIWPEYTPRPSAGIGFDLTIERTAGQTSVTVTNVTGIRGSVLISWAGATYANTLTKTFTTEQTILVAVKGSGNQNSEALSRSVAITIQPAASGGAGSSTDSRLGGIIWRDFGNNTVRVEANGGADLQVRLRTTDSWADMTNYAPQYYEALFTGIGAGAYNAQLRVSGETDSTKWKAWAFTKQ